MRHLTAFCIAIAIVGSSALARAGCDKDTDCKGDRVCEKGVCVSVGASATPEAAAEGAPREEAPPVSPPKQLTAPAAHVRAGWSRGAGITGLILAPIVMGLYIGAAVTDPQKGGNAVPAAPLGGTGLILHVVTGAIVGAGALSARGVRHNIGCLVSGWVFYGLTTLYTVMLFAVGFGLNQGPPHPAAIGVGSLLSVTGLVTLSVDALIVASRAHRQEDLADAADTAPRPALYPVLMPLARRSQVIGMVGGLGLRF